MVEYRIHNDSPSLWRLATTWATVITGAAFLISCFWRSTGVGVALAIITFVALLVIEVPVRHPAIGPTGEQLPGWSLDWPILAIATLLIVWAIHIVV